MPAEKYFENHKRTIETANGNEVQFPFLFPFFPHSVIPHLLSNQIQILHLISPKLKLKKFSHDNKFYKGQLKEEYKYEA